MDALGFPYTEDDIAAVEGKTDLDAIVAYLQVIGTAVTKQAAAGGESVVVEAEENPLTGDPNALAAGKGIFEENCLDCHGEKGGGDIGPSLIDNIMVHAEGDLSDAHYYVIIEKVKILTGRV